MKGTIIKALLVYPDYPDTFWSFKYALKFISRKATEPPMGLLTVAAMLPKEWEKRLVDMKVKPLKEKDLKWADIVFIGGMSIQKKSAKEVIARCKRLGVRTVAGGPLFTTESEEFDGIDHLVLNEAEITLQPFLEDLKKGCAKPIYTSKEFPDLRNTPVPALELIDINDYATMDIQYSRGCPYNCEFCDIVQLFGRKVRTKSEEQIIAELDAIYARGWRNEVFFVDDNFIGNKKKLKSELLPAMVKWNENKRQPLIFAAQASINLADDEELMKLMIKAGFNSVFIGIETTNQESLMECNKTQNKNRDLVQSIKKIQEHGMMVKGGFIVGFDSDPPAIFDNLIEFIQKSLIVNAMVGLLNAPCGTRLYKRLSSEGRLLRNASGDNTDLSINFIPKMEYENLIIGYKKVIKGIYSPKPYYERVTKFIETYKPIYQKEFRFRFKLIKPLFKSILFIGIVGKERVQYWKLFFWSLFKHPRLFHLAMTFGVYGFHFRKTFDWVS